MVNGHLPFDINGVWSFPQIPNRSLVEDYLQTRGIENDFLLEQLTNKFYTFTDAMLNDDEKTIEKMAEKRFAAKLLPNLKDVKQNKVKLVRDISLIEPLIKENTTNFGELRNNLISDNKDSYIVENILIKGISSLDRDQNYSNYDYFM